MGSPARGDAQHDGESLIIIEWKFPFNWVPLREGTPAGLKTTKGSIKFPFNWVPLREGTQHRSQDVFYWFTFPFNWVPLREGTHTRRLES